MNLWKENDYKHYWQSPGRQKPDDGEFSLDCGVITDNREHVEPFNGHSEDGEEASDNGHDKQSVEKFEMVAALVRHVRNETNDSIQKQSQGQERGGDDVGVWEETMGRRLLDKLFDEYQECANTGTEADTANDNVQCCQINCHFDQIVYLELNQELRWHETHWCW